MTIRAILVASLVLALPACASDETASEEVVSVEGAGQETRVLTAETAKATTEEGGVFKEYFAGETAATTDLLSGTATIKAGLEIHPPHRHAEEEFLMVVSGEGEWTVGEDTFAAREGDMLYAAAWDTHGIKNTGDEPLTFVFWKWNSRGLPVPVDPEL